MHLRKSLGALVIALVVVGALGASVSSAHVAPLKKKPRPAAKHKPLKGKLQLCAFGEQSGPGRCRANPAFAKTACEAWTPAVEAFAGGPAQLSPAGNQLASTSSVACLFRAGADLAQVQAGAPLSDVPVTVNFLAEGKVGSQSAANVKNRLAQIRQAAAMPLAELQKQYESGSPDTPDDPCFVYDPPGGIQDVVPFDAPQLVPGLGDFAFVWEVCTTAMAGLPSCASVPNDPHVGGPTARCRGDRVWWPELDVLKGNDFYRLIVDRPTLSVTDDQLVSFMKTLMARYH